MTVKDLKAQIAKVPDDASVRFITSETDNITQDYYDAVGVLYFEYLHKDGSKAVVLFAQ